MLYCAGTSQRCPAQSCSYASALIDRLSIARAATRDNRPASRLDGDGDSTYSSGVRRGVSACVAAAVAVVLVAAAQSASPASPAFGPAQLVAQTDAPGALQEIATADLTGDGIADVL